jgi:glutamate-5-semialdehyde dehydrogenase
MTTKEKAALGKRAAEACLGLETATKNAAIETFAAALKSGAARVFEANAADLTAAEREGLAAPLLKRLKFDERKLGDSVAGLRALRELPDPVGRVLCARRLDEGLELRQVSCPIGLIAMIFESRPDALVQMSALAAKSGNAVILKGGREAARTNRALADLIYPAGVAAGLPENWLALIESREEVSELLALDEYVDLIVPRGSKEFVASIKEHSRIPVMGHADGICHVYVHEDADPAMAVRVAVDSKAQSPATCNAAEALLVHSAFAARPVGTGGAVGSGLAALAGALEAAGVKLELCPRSAALLGRAPTMGEDDWAVEYLDLRMAIKIVDSLDEAIAHINRFGSRHTDSIVSSSREAARRFMDRVDSAGVYWNASTRFADGYRYGLGAEVGISTGKLHARGPVGLEGLCTYKWKLEGSGQIVADYASGARNFKHEELGHGDREEK